MKALFVHSPAAGTEPEPVQPMLEALTHVGLDLQYCEHAKDDIAAGARNKDLVIAAGGDGTVTSVATQIVDRTTPILILPLGGSNNIARALGLRQSIEDIIAGLNRATEAKLTIANVVGPFGERAFLEAVGLGALTQAIQQVDEAPETPEEKRENGRIAFREALREAPAFDCVIEIDGRAFEGAWLLVEILNIDAIGPRLPFAPRAKTGDPFLDILLVKASDRTAMARWADHFSGPPPARIEQGRHVMVTGHGRQLRVDDRTIDLPNAAWKIEIALQGQPATFLIPCATSGGSR
jgi:diacylglycerol kinase family enzyme